MRLSPFISLILYCTAFAIFLSLQQYLLNTGINPIHLNTYTYVFAALFFSIYLAFNNRAVFAISSRRGLSHSIVIALLSSVLADLLVLYGLRIGSPITWSLLVCLAPLVTYLLATIYVGDIFTLPKLASITLSIVGAMVVVYLPGVGIDLVHGAPYFLVAIFLFGIVNIMSQIVFRHVTPLQLTWVKLTTAALTMLVLSQFFPAPSVPINWLLIMANSLLLLSANILVNQIIHRAGATYFSIGVNLAPVFVVILSIVSINVWPTSTQLVGGLVIIGSIVLFQSVKEKALAP